MGRRSCLLALLLSLAPGAEAQDVVYRSWRWLKEPSAARAAGLGGAMTAVPDDASSAESNPAGLTTLSKSELTGNVLGQGAFSTSDGDARRARTGIGYLGLSGRLSARWAVGAYVVEPQGVRLETEGGVSLPGFTETGRLEGTLTEAGASAAWRPAGRLHVGVRVAATRLRLDGRYSLASASQPPLVDVATRTEATAVTTGIGLLYEASPRVRLGLARVGGARFEAPRSAQLDGVSEPLLADGEPTDIRQPTVVSGGLAVLASPRVLLTGQLDYVRYGEMETPFPSAGAADGRRLAVFVWEPRAGIEVSLPFSSFSVQVRAGLATRGGDGVEAAAGREALTAAPTPPPLPTAARAAFVLARAALPEAPEARASGATRGSFGASLVTRGLRLDVALRLGGEGSAFVAGTALRF